jgi:Uncharacterised nucleotidyltransferase
MVTPRYDRRVAGNRQAVMRRLATDALTAEVIEAMGAAGIRALLFKGPVVERWLYDQPGERTYGDIDLLVAPSDFAPAESVLTELGFEMVLAGFRDRELQSHERDWARDWCRVDLHRALWGFGCSAEVAWAVISESTDRFEIGGATVEVPAEPVHALIVAVHALKHGPPQRWSSELRLAINRTADSMWWEAAKIATRVDALGPFTVGLQTIPSGRELVDRLGLHSVADAEAHLRALGFTPGSLTLLHVANAAGSRARLSLIMAKLGPSPAFMRYQYPLARRGRLGLAAAYGSRFVAMCRQAPAGLRSLRAAQTRARQN